MDAKNTSFDAADRKTFDYVIIGGGTAGLTLAARLTERPDVEVLVLEAGEERLDDPKIQIPNLMTSLYGDTSYDWNFHTTPQPGLNNRAIAFPRGKVLGGSSAINFLMCSHASRLDIDNWEALGNHGWNFDTLQPYYRKSETYHPPSADANGQTGYVQPELHGAQGPLQTSFPRGTGELDAAWGSAFETLGLRPKADPRAGSTLGGFPVLKYMDIMGRRSHAGNAFYAPNEGRGNLTVVTGALVTKIVLEPREGGVVVAAGVQYDVGGETHVVQPKKGGEVLLCAGTVQSPQLLELSGVGDRTLLERLGIQVLVENSNVGENLQDHNMVGFAYQVRDGVPTGEMLSQPGVLDWALNEWSTKGAGPLAGGATGTAFLSHVSVLPSSPGGSESSLLSLLASTPEPKHAGLAQQYVLQKAQLLDPAEADLQFNFGAMGVNPQGQSDISKIFAHGNQGAYAGIMTALTHPFSRGSVHISSSSAQVHPSINPCYLSHPLDVELLAQGLLFTQTIASASPLADLFVDNEAKDGKRPQPGFGVQGRMTKEDAVRIVRETSGSSWHPVGTCSMLPRDQGGVVDAEMRVYGVAGLRVVDASVVPLNVRGNIASAVYAIAERMADVILSSRESEKE